MLKPLMAVTITAGMLIGCSSHTAAPTITGQTFKGDPAVSLGGNMELLAGNQKIEGKNKDKQIDQSGLSQLGVSGALAGAVSSSVASAALLTLSLNQTVYERPENDVIVFAKVKDGIDPASENALRDVYQYSTNKDNAQIKELKCKLSGDVLVCSKNNDELLKIKYTYTVEPALMKRIEPSYTDGRYAAYAVIRDRNILDIASLDDEALNAKHIWLYSIKEWVHTLDTPDIQNRAITYNVDKPYQTNNKTLVQIAKKTEGGIVYTNSLR